ncbi:MAG: M48 family metalloprotease [Gammaproteobacteria bacterium]|nr:M48 family metalloprotease [Gammaproteobacteria bacterium]
MTSGYADTERVLIPDMGNQADSSIGPLEEKRTGEAVIRNIRRAGQIIDDPLLENYLNHLGFSLVAVSNTNDRDFRFFMLNDRDINAFALPGGFIGVNYGLILAAHSESELASVLAHEIAHITQRHHARVYAMGDRQIPIVAALIAAMILGANDSEIGEAALATAAAASVQEQINFTRSNEKEADRIGISMLAAAGYSPEAMATFFDRLDQASRLHGPQAPEFLRTHPVNTSRIADAKNRATQLPKAEMQTESDFHHARARIRALAHYNKKTAISEFEKNLKSGSYQHKEAEQYGYVLALLRADNHKQARKIMEPLLAKDPQRIAYIIAMADIEASSKQTQKAGEVYRKALELYPGNKVITYYYTRYMIDTEQFAKAKELLREQMRTPVDFPTLYRLLSRAEAALGNESAAHEAMAEYYYLSGQLHQAISQIELAIKTNHKDDFYRTTQMEAKLQQYQSEIIQPGNQPVMNR